MNFLDEFDEPNIDFIDRWIEENDADIRNIKPVSVSKIKKLLNEDYGSESEG